MSSAYLPTNEFGFTGDQTQLEAVREFVLAACADSWGMKPTYPGIEGLDRAATLEREGFKMLILTRDNTTKWLKNGKWGVRYEASIHIWGSDRLAIKPPATYSWEAISDGVGICQECGATNVKTTRVGFAGRVCHICLPVVRPRVEFPGWTN